ncbi:MAG TPA: hypothetical protein VEA99_18235 [Gemmatimonadaceae bacterium]|nr:hypothetical protein [Gemmatimonadaceae bacterium]
MEQRDERRAPAITEELIPEILTGWVACLRGNPNACLRVDERGFAERNLLRAILRVARSEGNDEQALQALAQAASRYGGLQSIHRVDPGEVIRQFGCLRSEIELVLASRCSADTAFGMLVRVDAALSVATLSVIRAGHSL